MDTPSLDGFVQASTFFEGIEEGQAAILAPEQVEKFQTSYPHINPHQEFKVTATHKSDATPDNTSPRNEEYAEGGMFKMVTLQPTDGRGILCTYAQRLLVKLPQVAGPVLT